MFSRETLERALRATGFRPVRWQTIGLRLMPRESNSRFYRLAAKALAPCVEVLGQGGRLHVFAERTCSSLGWQAT